MPNSNDDVATTHRRVPDFRPSSTSARAVADIDPWWVRANSSSSLSQSSFKDSVSRSAERRELTNTIIDRYWAAISIMRASTCGHIETFSSAEAPAAGWVISTTGTETV